MSVHTDVIGLIESAEHAYLRELRHSREHHKLQVLVGILENAIESFEYIPIVCLVCYLLTVIILIIQCIVVHHIEQRLVVFVNQYNGSSPRLLMCCLDDMLESYGTIVRICRSAIYFFKALNIIEDNSLQSAEFCEVGSAERQMEYRIYIPLLLKRVNLQASELLDRKSVV